MDHDTGSGYLLGRFGHISTCSDGNLRLSVLDSLYNIVARKQIESQHLYNRERTMTPRAPGKMYTARLLSGAIFLYSVVAELP